MPDGNEKSGGSEPEATPAGPGGSSSDLRPDLFELHKLLTSDFWATWVKARDQHVTVYGHIPLSRVSIVSLSQMAATFAVDLNMAEEQFLATCKANFAEAVKNAPRFG